MVWLASGEGLTTMRGEVRPCQFDPGGPSQFGQ